MHDTTKPIRMIRCCVKWERRLAASEEELALYQRLSDEYPDMVSEDYDPYQSVCVEWGEREATFIDDLPDFMERLAPTDTPLMKMMGTNDSDTVTWGITEIPDTD